MIWFESKNLSDSDVELLAKASHSKMIETMMRNRILVDFDQHRVPTDFTDLGLDNTEDVYYIKTVGPNVVQFWFNSPRDMENFEQYLCEYKLTNS